jgi:DNA polymerase-3 subunit beta
MKLNCKKSEFLKGLQIIQSAISNKSTLPVLMNVMVETLDDKVTLSATDLDISVTRVVSAEISKHGATTIPGRKLFEITRELPSEEFTIEVDSNNLIKITSKNAVYKLVGLPKGDFPVIPQFNETNSFSLKREVLSEMIKKTRFAVSTDETRYVLCGILMMVDKGKIKMISTDGRRLSFIQKSLSLEKKNVFKAIIPTKAVVELSRMLEFIGEDTAVKIDVGDNQIGFNAEETTLVSRLIDGHFPNYEQVIPQESKIKITIKTDALLQATRRVSLLSSEKSNFVKYTFSKNTLTLTAKTQDMGEAQDKIDIDYAGDPLEIGYNPVFVTDVLSNVGTDEVIIELTNALNPGIIRPATDDYLAVIMPMRV